MRVNIDQDPMPMRSNEFLGNFPEFLAGRTAHLITAGVVLLDRVYERLNGKDEPCFDDAFITPPEREGLVNNVVGTFSFCARDLAKRVCNARRVTSEVLDSVSKSAHDLDRW